MSGQEGREGAEQSVANKEWNLKSCTGLSRVRNLPIEEAHCKLIFELIRPLSH